MSEITIEHVTKVYDGGVLAVDDISLAVADGEFLVSSGHPGAASRPCCG